VEGKKMKSSIRHALLFVGLVAALGIPAGATAAASHTTAGSSAGHSSERMLRETMRKLWTDHVVWTREYVVAAVAGTPDADAAAKRLMKNQEDIGNAIATFYGKPAGDKLTSLLKQHISIAVDLVNAAKANNQPVFNEANAKWKQNGSDIANFLAQANPNWPAAAMVDAMNMHLQTTTREVVDLLQKNYDDDVVAFDAVYEHILHMADALSDGIIKQFPDKFAA
jgi:hypothetical protein